MKYHDGPLTRENVIAACIELLPTAEDMLADGTALPMVLKYVAAHCFEVSVFDGHAAAIVRTAMRNLHRDGTVVQ